MVGVGNSEQMITGIWGDADAAKTLTDLVERAEETSRRLELQMAALHDIPSAPKTTASKAPPPETDGPMFTRHRNTQDAA